jgi:hypothetical protein
VFFFFFYIKAGTVLGVALLFTFAFAIGAIVQANHVTIGLVLLNWLLLVDGIITLVIGTFVWYYTLRERDNFHTAFAEQSQANQIAIQDYVSKSCNISVWILG